MLTFFNKIITLYETQLLYLELSINFTMQEDLLLVDSAHQDNLKEMMQQMIVSETFADVTLVGDDKKYIKAHKAILSACSPFIKSILQMDTDTNNAMIYLEGIQYAEIESLLQFVYFGEATLSQERVNDIVSVSKTLQIEELSNWYEDPHPHDATHEDLIAKPVGLAATTLRASRKTNESPIDANVHSVKSKKVEYVCMKCGEQFSTKNFLKKHNQYIHETDPSLKVKMITVYKGLKMVRCKTKLYCFRGCGSQFVKEDACKRHESYCTFTAKYIN